MVTHGGTLHGWLRIGGSRGLLFVAYTLCRVSGFDDDDEEYLPVMFDLLERYHAKMETGRISPAPDKLYDTT